MAHIKFLTSSHHSADFATVQAFLKDEGIEFGSFKLTSLALKYQQQDALTDEERMNLLNSYVNLINKYSTFKGYRADVVCLYPKFEHIQAILKKFGDIHFHYENEFWYFIDGYFDFIFLNNRGLKYQVTVNAGEYLQVPEGKWQSFFGTDEQRMKAMRFFYTTEQILAPPELTQFINLNQATPAP